MLPLLFSLLTAAAPAGHPKVFALVVGNNRAIDERTAALKFADDDAVAMHELLLEAGARSILLVNADPETRALHPIASSVMSPTLTALNAAWDQLRNEMATASATGPTEFIFFFSGHGDVEHGEGYLSLERDRFTRGMLQKVLGASPAQRNHVVVDACKAYFAVLSKGVGGRREPYLKPFANEPNVMGRSGFLLSTSSAGDSHEWEQYQAGVFSFELRSGLRGSADLDRDGVITYRELGGFLQRANAGIVNSKFRPDFLVVPPGDALDQPVLRWPAESAALNLEGPAAHLYVEAPSGHRVLEFNRGATASIALRLPPERPLFVRSADEREERVLESREPTELSSLPISTPSVSKKGALHLAFGQLFSQSFDASAIESFGADYALRARVEPESPSTRDTVTRVALFTGLGAAAVTAVGLAVAIERSSVTPTTSQRERLARNDGIAAANTTMVVAGGVAAAALGTWLVLTLTKRTEPELSIGVGPSGVSVSGQW